MKCPKCGSSNIEVKDYRGTKCIVCKDCGYDQRDELDIVPEQKKSQKAKGKFSPYKAGGKDRSK